MLLRREIKAQESGRSVFTDLLHAGPEQMLHALRQRSSRAHFLFREARHRRRRQPPQSKVYTHGSSEKFTWLASMVAIADQSAAGLSPRSCPRVSKLPRRFRLSFCPLGLGPSFGRVGRRGRLQKSSLGFRSIANFATMLFAQDRVPRTTRKWREGQSVRESPER